MQYHAIRFGKHEKDSKAWRIEFWRLDHDTGELYEMSGNGPWQFWVDCERDAYRMEAAHVCSVEQPELWEAQEAVEKAISQSMSVEELTPLITNLYKLRNEVQAKRDKYALKKPEVPITSPS